MGHDQSEFARFYRSSWDPCLRAVLARLGSRELAEELVAEAFARAWSHWRTVGRHPAPRAWVVRTALNTGTTWWRRRRHEIPLADHDRSVPGGEADALDLRLLDLLRRLPERQREVVVLRVLLDLDTETAAGELGMAPATVRVHLSRALATLRKELARSSAEKVPQ